MLPLFAAVLPIVILFCGLVIDVSLLQVRKIQMQGAADAAAQGAETQYERTINFNSAINAGVADAALNGFTNGASNTTVGIGLTPNYGSYAGFNDGIQATITQKVPSFFMGALNGGSVTLSARAVALNPPCLVVTNAAHLVTYPLALSSAAQFTAWCPIYVNTALSVDSSVNFGVIGENVSGPASNSVFAGTYKYLPRYNARTISDPLASIVQPTVPSTCAQTSYSKSGGSVTLNPGLYCKGLTLSNTTATFNPGLYIITGGASWSGSVVNGTGVTFFFTKGGGTTSFGEFVVDSTYILASAPVDASAGGIPTILIFGDRGWVKSSAQDFQITNTYLGGDSIWYTTGTGISLSGAYITTSHYFSIVTDNLTITGTSNNYPYNLGSDYSHIPTGNPFETLGGLVQ